MSYGLYLNLVKDKVD